MAVRCASCGEAIRKGQPIKIAGTEVFHPACVGEIANSRTHRLAKRTLEQRSELSRLHHELDVARENVRRVQQHAENTEQRARLVEQEIAGARRILQLAQDLKTSDDILIRRLERQRDEANTNATAARNELALLRTLAQPAPQPAVVRPSSGDPLPDPEPDKDERDDLTVRASLLELD